MISFTKLINHNLRLPVSIAQNFIDNTNATINVFDLINEGNLALVKAAQSFDSSKNGFPAIIMLVLMINVNNIDVIFFIKIDVYFFIYVYSFLLLF